MAFQKSWFFHMRISYGERTLLYAIKINGTDFSHCNIARCKLYLFNLRLPLYPYTIAIYLCGSARNNRLMYTKFNTSVYITYTMHLTYCIR